MVDVCTRLQLATTNIVAASKSTSNGAISQGFLIMVILYCHKVKYENWLISNLAFSNAINLTRYNHTLPPLENSPQVATFQHLHHSFSHTFCYKMRSPQHQNTLQQQT